MSVVKSDDRLSNIGGSFLQDYTLPADPMLLLQRTGTACMSESGWPPNSIDPETTEYYYDDTCEVEKPQAPDVVGCQQCHCQHPLTTMSCVEALQAFVGRVNVSLNFTRIKYDKAMASKWRYPSEPSINSFGQVAPVNIFEYLPDLERYRIIYLYIEPNGCEIAERCVGGSGWRRLLVFSTTAPNFGTQELRLGSVPYFTNGSQSELITKHHVFEYSPCHKHYHFSHYASFALGNPNDQSNLTNTKRGFCLQAVYRHANAEWSPLHQEYYTCSVQGIPPGWQDTYQGGLRCQWIDVTSINTSAQPYTTSLYSSLNPHGFLCEGTPQPDTWIRTEFNTTCCSGNGCCGESNLTQCCGGLPVVRICEASIALRSGLACLWNASLTTVIISHRDKPRDIHFICPPPRDSVETGGQFSVYYGPLFTDLAFGDLSWSKID
ncbi:unnamed protein product [Rotaria sordida]|uniref:Uncharacterized protein n=1 Tax=Rotaria sordida TaxID=392033 RepID=A0A818XCW1_9BILA|nr:unnamed protein product [Rotaria sordida]